MLPFRVYLSMGRLDVYCAFVLLANLLIESGTFQSTL